MNILVNTKLEHINTVTTWLRQKMTSGAPDMAVLVTLFGGDRLHCCDEAIVAHTEENTIVGITTLSPTGEMAGEGPTIVGLYVEPNRRRCGVGTRLLTAAVNRMATRGLVPVRIDILSTAAILTVKALPTQVQDQLIVKQYPPMLDMIQSMIQRSHIP